jgi:hypothetical protein
VVAEVQIREEISRATIKEHAFPSPLEFDDRSLQWRLEVPR